MTAFLPQHDPQSPARAESLKTRQRNYQFNYEYVCPLALCQKPPFPDEYSLKWSLQVAQSSRAAFLNVIELEDDSHFRSTYLTAVKKMTQALSKSELNLEKFFSEIMKTIVDVVDDTKPEQMRDYADMFRRVGLPPICRYYQQDRMFVNQRTAGPNPVMLRRMDGPDDRFPVTEAHYRASMPEEDSLEAACQEGRLYWVDYHMLDGVENGDYPRRQKYLYAPMALFAVHRQTGELRPVAIQCQQQPGPDNPIFTPKHGWNWRIAKLIVEIADGNVHQPVTHLGNTHLLMEPFVITTRRQLGQNHPLSILLSPHFEGTLHINYMAHKELIAPKNIVDRLLAGKIESTAELVVNGLKDYPFDDAMLPAILKARGVEDAELLPDYPYRDDAILYWHAIEKWVREYLALYYQSDRDVDEDYELQNWYAELVSQDGGRVFGFGKNGGIHSISYLADVATLILFTASVQHAAVNFPQVDLLSYIPNMPLAGYSPAPTTTEGATEADYMAMLPPKDQTLVQMATGQLLGNSRYTSIGRYGPKQFEDAAVKQPLRDFQSDIESIGETIAERNRTRHPYVYLTPPGIPQSINI